MGEYCRAIPYKRRSRYKSAKGASKRKGPIILSALILAVVLLIVHIVVNVNPVVRSASEQKVKIEINKIINSAAQETFGDKYGYSDFVEVTNASDGSVSFLQMNSVLINVLARNIVLNAQEGIDALSVSGVSVPLGAFSGITLFSAQGWEVSVNMLSMGAVTYRIKSEFESAGINQTIHRVYLLFESSLTLILPGSDAVIETEIPIVISESIIVGKIPSVVL